MKNRLTVSAALLILSALQGCSFNNTFNSRLEFIPNGKVPCTRPVSAANVELYRSSQPTKKYVEIGTVSAQYNTYENTLMKLKEKAAQNCTDALIDLRETAVGVMTRINATAIKFE